MKTIDISLCIITMNRFNDLRDTLSDIYNQNFVPKEILILDNNSNNFTREKYLKFKKYQNLKFFYSSENLGVAGGRTFILKKATQKYIVELDDDINLTDKNFFKKISQSFSSVDSNVGILAFKIINFHNKKIQRKEYPFYYKSFKHKQVECAWFIGAGHAFKKQLIDQLGGYRDFFPYGSEEQDLALRAIDNGYKINYIPSISLFHKQNPDSREHYSAKLAELLFTHRMLFALLNLPIILFFFHFSIRGSIFVLKYRQINLIVNCISNLLNKKNYIRLNRKPIKFKTIFYLLKINGQVFF